MTKCVVLFRDIGNYHAARLGAVLDEEEIDLQIIEVASSAAFAEFRAKREVINRLPIHSLGVIGALSSSKVSSPLQLKLEQLNPDVVFVPGWSMVEARVALNWCAKNSIPCVVMSESTKHDFERSVLSELIKSRLIKNSGSFLVGGTDHAEYAMSLGAAREQIFFGYDVVSNVDFQRGAAKAKSQDREQRTRLNLPDKFFFCAARLIEKKNIGRLLDAYAAYIDKNLEQEPWSLVIAGPGPLQEQIDRQINELNLTKMVHLLGAVNYDDMKVCYGLAEALVHASTTEQWGLVVNEAMASGLPVLVSERCGSATDLVHNEKNGFKFNPFDTEEISSVLTRISNPQTDLNAMGVESQRIIADWGPQRFKDGFKKAAVAAVNGGPPKASLFDRLLLQLAASR